MRMKPDENPIEMEQLIEIGIALSAEKNHSRLLDMIVREARRVSEADAGTLYLRVGDKLEFKIIQNDSLQIYQGGENEAIALPPVPMVRENVSAAAALNRRVINIPDVYHNQDYDFVGPRRYDAMTGYRTESMLVVPMEDYEGEIIGVLQLINAQDAYGNVIPFPLYLEKVVSSLASQAAVSITNMRYIEEVDALFHSVVEVIATAIDERSPYNVNHTRHIAELAVALGSYLDQQDAGTFKDTAFDEHRLDQLRMAALLHDVGKVATPLSIMDKPTRLGERFELVLMRFDLIHYQIIADAYAQGGGVGSSDELEERLATVKRARHLVSHVNDPRTFVDAPIVDELQTIAAHTYRDQAGEPQPWLMQDELTALSIRKGTLTAQERKIMENHVVVTERMLSKIAFNKKYAKVPEFAISHHEFLDGSGYHRKLIGSELPLESRILTLLDIYDALTASDRPYKRAMPHDKAVEIIGYMVKEGKLDADLVAAFIESGVWQA